MVAITVAVMFAVIELASGLFLAATPYLMRKNECFAVTVPSAAQADPRVVALKKRYAKAMVTVTVAFAAVAAAAGMLIVYGSGDSAAMGNSGVVLECVAVIGPAAASFLLMLESRKKVIAIKRAEGWAAARRERAAVVGEEEVPRPIPLAWNLIYVIIILLTAALGLIFYPSMPDVIPVHADFAGNVDGYAEKSIGAVFGFPLLMEAFMALTFFGCHAIMIRSKHPTDPGAPATSALAYGLFARAQSVFLLVVGVAINAGIGIGFMLSSAGIITLAQFAVAMIIVGVLITIGAIALSVVYGQAGSRLFRRMQGDGYLPDDDDEHWKLGILYVNRDDPSVFLPERFGIGWTINFARPAAWILVGCFLAAVILVSIAVLLLA